jgi:hypothetical protein
LKNLIQNPEFYEHIRKRGHDFRNWQKIEADAKGYSTIPRVIHGDEISPQ